MIPSYTIGVAMTLLRVMLLFLLGFTSSVASVQADQSLSCPKKLATIATNVLSIEASKAITNMYKKLGCPVEMEALPGRRGIRHFNEKRVDGELLRIEKVELSYEREYIRSSVSLMTVSSSLWLHPDSGHQDKYPIGYVVGIVWHERAITSYKGIAFNDEAKMYEAYRKGRLGGFLSSDITLNIWLKSHDLSPTPDPVEAEVLLVSPLYHYLGAEFAPFMQRFSALVVSADPFKELQISDR